MLARFVHPMQQGSMVMMMMAEEHGDDEVEEHGDDEVEEHGDDDG